MSGRGKGGLKKRKRDEDDEAQEPQEEGNGGDEEESNGDEEGGGDDDGDDGESKKPSGYQSLPSVLAADKYSIKIPAGAFDAGLLWRHHHVPSTTVLKILGWCDGASLAVLQTTSKANYSVLRHEDVWRQFITGWTRIIPRFAALIAKHGLRLERLGREYAHILHAVSTSCLYGHPVPAALAAIWFDMLVVRKGVYTAADNESGEDGNARKLWSQHDALSFWTKNHMADKAFTKDLNEDMEDNEEFMKKLEGRVAWVGWLWQTEESRPFGYWLGDAHKVDGVVHTGPCVDLAKLPVIDWQVYQGPFDTFRPKKNLLSYVARKGDDETQFNQWVDAHASLEKVSDEDLEDITP